ncbi:hypothetical protein [Streptomyces sp. L2]|nr:hypothetical protein [Streptomyces sp. L2]
MAYPTDHAGAGAGRTGVQESGRAASVLFEGIGARLVSSSL